MIRKLLRNTIVHGGITPFIVVLSVIIALAAQAEIRGAGQVSGKSRAPSGPRNVDGSLAAPAALQLPGGNMAKSGAPVRARRNRFAPDAMGPSAPFFLPPVTYDPLGYGIGFPGVSVAIADVNGDAKPDLLVANLYACSSCANGSVAVLLGNGDGTFQPAVDYDSGAPATVSVVVADVNGDGKPDLVVGNDCGGCSFGALSVLLGNGDGTFQPAVIYESSVGGVPLIAVADVNGDGQLDAASVVPDAGAGKSDGVMIWWRGTGGGDFQAQGGPYGGGYDTGGEDAVRLALADVNGDGKADVVVVNHCTYNNGFCSDDGSVGVLLWNGDLTFAPVVTYAGVSKPSDVVITDVNGDGEPDLLVANSSGMSVLLGNGDGTFQPATGYPSSSNSRVAVSDVNGDGKPDLVGESSGSVSVLLGNGDGTFQPAETQAEDDYLMSIAVADLNGDGRIDLAVGTMDATGTKPLVGVMLHVGAVSTSTKVIASLNPSVFGQAVKFTATVSSGSGTPTGTVIFYDGSTSLGSATLVNRRGSISTSLLQAGSHSITAVYQGSLKFNSSLSAPLQQVLNPASTTSSLTSSLNPVLITEFITYTATVASQYGGAVTGTVTFQDGGVTVATATVVGGQAAYTTKYSTPGTHSITVTYSGDMNNTGSTSSTLVEQVNKGFSSKTVLITSGSPSFVGQPVTFTATLTSGHGPIPDGELVTFSDGQTVIGTGTTTSGFATFTTASLTLKTHTIRATYPGDTVFQSSTGSVSQVVEGYTTTTSLSSSPNPSQFGQAVTFTATLTSAGPQPTGKVKFLDGTVAIGSATLSGGVAKLTKSTLAVGTHPITAQYLGDAVSDKSTSSILNQVVQ